MSAFMNEVLSNMSNGNTNLSKIAIPSLRNSCSLPVFNKMQTINKLRFFKKLKITFILLLAQLSSFISYSILKIKETCVTYYMTYTHIYQYI